MKTTKSECLKCHTDLHTCKLTPVRGAGINFGLLNLGIAYTMATLEYKWQYNHFHTLWWSQVVHIHILQEYKLTDFQHKKKSKVSEFFSYITHKCIIFSHVQYIYPLTPCCDMTSVSLCLYLHPAPSVLLRFKQRTSIGGVYPDGELRQWPCVYVPGLDLTCNLAKTRLHASSHCKN